MDYHKHLVPIATEDAENILRDDGAANYAGSWKKRGGIGAFMMLARKWDRIEQRVSLAPFGYDIFAAVEKEERHEGIINDIRDLRRYLMLVEAYCRQQGHHVALAKLARDKEAKPLANGGEVEIEVRAFDNQGNAVDFTAVKSVSVEDSSDPYGTDKQRGVLCDCKTPITCTGRGRCLNEKGDGR